MREKIEELVRQALADAQAAGKLPEFQIDDVGLERPQDSSNGDWSSTVAMRSAKLAHKAPRDIAAALVAHIAEDAQIERVEVAGPGFVNFYLSTAAGNEIFNTVREQGADFGRSSFGAGQKVQVEYVSANPVGPLHIGHGRWAALGDSLSRILAFAGYEVEREYYVNDHGSQMDVFGHSISKRYLQLIDIMQKRDIDADAAAQVLAEDRNAYVADEDDAHPEQHPFTDEFINSLGGNAYAGDYIVDLGLFFLKNDGEVWADKSEDERMAEFRERGYKMMLESIKNTCHTARSDFDVWFSERSLYVKDDQGKDAVDRALDALDKLGYLYRSDEGALFFRSTDFGDDKDRVLIKTNGEYTYFASDVAYHWNKFQRVDHVIDIWGADHHGYIQRVCSAATALGYPTQFEVLLGQLVNLLRNGVAVRMSKRKGTGIHFDELLAEVGVDATRYTLVSKSSNQMIDFDIEQVKRQDSSNPVYYVQYAHARICSILRRAAGVDLDEAKALGMDAVADKAIGSEVDLGLLSEDAEQAVARKLFEFPGLVEGCARDRAPFRITHYIEELAGQFHAFYTVCQVLPSEGRPLDAELSKARLAACDATRRVLAIALDLIGVSAPEAM